MDRFVRDLLAQSPMAAADEIALARRARNGDRSARDDLILAGMRAVVLRARMRGLVGEELGDAVQSGALGLIRAVDRFDPERGARLATYAWHFIGAAMTVDRPPEEPLDNADRAIFDARGLDLDLLDGMPADLAEVIALRFGIGDPAGVPMPREAVAKRLQMTVAQVRSTEAKAMRQLGLRLARVTDRAPLWEEPIPHSSIGRAFDC